MATDNKKPGVLRNLRFKRVDLVDMGANFDAHTGDGAHIMLFKRADTPITKDGPTVAQVHVDSPDWDADDQDEYEKATLSGESRRSLPDSAFAAVWTDAQGKKHRKLPIHDAGHLAAARGRLDAAQIPADTKAAARRKIESATTHTPTHKKEQSVAKTMKTFLKSLTDILAEPDVTKRATLLKAAEEEVTAMKDADEGKGETFSPEHLAAMKSSHSAMGATIKAFGAGPHAPEHPVHAMKAMHSQLGAQLKKAGVECESDEPGGLDHPAVTKRFTDLEKRNNELSANLTIEKNLRLDREMVDVLKSFKATPFKLEGADSDVAKFRKMKEADPDGFARTIELLKAQDALMAKSALFKNLGSSAEGGGGSAWDRIEALADKIVEKDTKGITREAAIDRVLTDTRNRELVKQYRAEQQ